MRFAQQQRAHFSSLIRPHGPAPAALASLLSHPPDPQIIRKTLFRDFPQNPRTRLLSSDSPLSDSSYLKPRPSSAGARKPMRPSPCLASRAEAHTPKSPTTRAQARPCHAQASPITCPNHAHAWQARAGPCAKAVRAQATPTQAWLNPARTPFFYE